MTFARLVLRNLLYHWRGNLAVLLGVALGSAVLIGALLVGDSLRGSLRSLALDRLGWVDDAMLPGRFFQASLATKVPGRVAPVILLRGSAQAGDSSQVQRVGKVNVLGVDASFWPSSEETQGRAFWQANAAEVVVNEPLAKALGVVVGAQVALVVHKVEDIPRESLLGKKKTEDVLDALRVTVRAIVPDEKQAGFSLRPTPAPVLNAFVPLAFLQDRLGQSGEANALLVADPGESPHELFVPYRDRELKKALTLADWGLTLRDPRQRAESFFRYLAGPRHEEGGLKKVRWRGRVPEALEHSAVVNGNVLTKDRVVGYWEKQHRYVALESRQLLLPPVVVRAMHDLPDAGKQQQTLIYLVDTLASGGHEAPYVVVAGTSAPWLPGPNDDAPGKLGDDEIALARWPGSPFEAKPGDDVELVYYAPDERNGLEKRTAHFELAYTFPLMGRADDPDLTPMFPGITDKLDMASWENPPFPYDPRRVKPADEEYWKRYRATPRAYVSLNTAQRLWGSRFGQVTSIELHDAPPVKVVAERLLARLEPQQGGFVFQPVREQALAASAGSSDFGLLFACFSVFLIVSALLLVGLLFRLNLERRASELGLLLATGWSSRRARRLLLAEGLVLAVVGSGLGLLGALAYAPAMLQLLQVNWPGEVGWSFLRLHAQPVSFAIGFGCSLLVSVLTIVWAGRVLGRLSPRALLAGVTSEDKPTGQPVRPWTLWLAIAAVLGAVASAAFGRMATDHEARASGFFGSGALLLTAGLAVATLWLRRLGHDNNPRPSVAALGIRNASRNPTRSLLTIGLLASATFVVVAVECFHKDTGRDFFQHTGGSGGFALYAESAVPFFQDLDQPAVRRELDLTGPVEREVRFYPCRVRAGDDTSCLNLYQPLRPRLLAFSPALVARGGFHFAETLAETPEEKANPWTLLERKTADGAIPVILDANTARWVLHVDVGGLYEITDEDGSPVQLRVVGRLQDSIFQSEILLAEADFLRLFPRQEGFTFALIDTGNLAADRSAEIQAILQRKLSPLGLDVASTASRVQAYQAVENTYLTTFQALGGLGLILGALGLAIVLLRGVWERRSELALLRAVGFRPSSLAWLVLAENATLLAVGLAIGSAAACLAVAPHLAGHGAEVLWLRLAVLLAAVLAVGLSAGLAAVLVGVRVPVLQALRRE